MPSRWGWQQLAADSPLPQGQCLIGTIEIDDKYLWKVYVQLGNMKQLIMNL
jgi:hypothetical protein